MNRLRDTRLIRLGDRFQLILPDGRVVWESEPRPTPRKTSFGVEGGPPAGTFLLGALQVGASAAIGYMGLTVIRDYVDRMPTPDQMVCKHLRD